MMRERPKNGKKTKKGGGGVGLDRGRGRPARTYRKKTALYKSKGETSENIHPADTWTSDF